MTRRIAVLTLGLWLGLYVSQWLVGTLWLTRAAWVAWIPQTALTLIAAWFVARWRGLTGSRLAVSAALAVPVAWIVWYATSLGFSALPMTFLDDLSPLVFFAPLYLAYAAEAVVVSWFLAGVLAAPDAHPTSAST